MTVVDLLRDLAVINSVNPSLVAGAPGEGEIAAYIRRWAVDQGLDAQIVEPTPGRPSVVVRGGGRRGGRSLLLCGHLDTVGRPDESPRITGERMYGRGTYDMKAGLAAALVACRDATAAGIGGEVIVAAVADEEHSSTGIQEVLPLIRADAAIVTEPTELTVGTAHKGFVWTEIEVRGRAAHGSRPHLGDDAILKTGPILVALERLNRRLADRPHPALGPGTLHASLISGGTSESTIPDRCLLTVERRTLPGEAVGDVEREIADVLAGVDAVSRTTLAREPFETRPDTEIVRLLAPAPVSAMSYWADSAFIAAAGIPAVLFGPAGDGAHADEEWVDLPSVVRCAETLTEVAVRFSR